VILNELGSSFDGVQSRAIYNNNHLTVQTDNCDDVVIGVQSADLSVLLSRFYRLLPLSDQELRVIPGHVRRAWQVGESAR
jgi:hypothetical protein